MARHLLCSLILAFSVLAAMPADSRHRDMLRMSTPELLEQCVRLAATRTTGAVDSAMTCAGLIISRFDEGACSRDDIGPTIRAMIIQSYLYSTRFNNYVQAYTLLKRAERLIGSYPGHDSMSVFVYLNMGVLVRNSEVILDRAGGPVGAEYFAKALDVSIRDGKWHAAAVAVYDLAEIYFEGGEPDRLRPFADRWLSAVPDSAAREYGAVVSMLDGIRRYGRGEMDAARASFERVAAGVSDDAELDAGLKAKSLLYRAFVAERMGDRYEADSLIACLCDIADHDDAPLEKVWLFENLTRFYRETRGDPAAADAAELRYYKSRHAESANPDFHGIDELKFEDSLDMLRQLNADDIARRRMTTYLVVGAGLVAVTVIVVLLMLLRSSRRKHRLLQALYQRNMMLLEKEADGGMTVRDNATVASQPSEKANTIDESTREILLRRIRSVMSDPERFTSPDFSLRQLAASVGSNTAYVSQIINRSTGKTFKEILGERRIAEACRRLDDVGRSGNMTVEAIANEVGFKSRTAFAAIFKSTTGMTPTEFRRMARDRHEKEQKQSEPAP